MNEPDLVALSKLEKPNVCVINGCGHPPGIGTWARIQLFRNQRPYDQPNLPVCDEHWKALRDVYLTVGALGYARRDDHAGEAPTPDNVDGAHDG